MLIKYWPVYSIPWNPKQGLIWKQNAIAKKYLEAIAKMIWKLLSYSKSENPNVIFLLLFLSSNPKTLQIRDTNLTIGWKPYPWPYPNLWLDMTL